MDVKTYKISVEFGGIKSGNPLHPVTWVGQIMHMQAVKSNRQTERLLMIRRSVWAISGRQCRWDFVDRGKVPSLQPLM